MDSSYNSLLRYVVDIYLYLGGSWIVLEDSSLGGVHPRLGKAPSAVEVVFRNGWYCTRHLSTWKA